MRTDEFLIQIKVKNNLILTAIEDRGYSSVRAFADDYNLPLQDLYGFIGFKKAPVWMGQWTPSSFRVAEALMCAPEDLWTKEMQQLDRENFCGSRIATLSSDALCRIRVSQTSLDQLVYKAEMEGILSKALEALPEREYEVIKDRFGLGIRDEHTLKECADKRGVSPARVRQIEAKALFKLRRNKKLIEARRDKKHDL